MMMMTMHATTTTACNARATKIRTTVKTTSSVKRVAMKRVVKVRATTTTTTTTTTNRSIDRVLDGRTGGSDEERRGVDDVVSRSVRGCFSVGRRPRASRFKTGW